MSSATAEVKETPIILSGAKVRAILEGHKTQERIPLKPQPLDVIAKRSGSCSPRVTRTLDGHVSWAARYTDDPVTGKMIYCRYGEAGNLLWVREALRCDERGMYYDADGTLIDKSRIPDDLKRVAEFNDPFHMPRWACRITLEIINVRVERLHDISCADVLSEGSPVPLREHSNPELGVQCVSAKEWFAEGWDKLNAKRGHSWESNPWVWAITFKRL